MPLAVVFAQHKLDRLTAVPLYGCREQECNTCCSSLCDSFTSERLSAQSLLSCFFCWDVGGEEMKDLSCVAPVFAANTALKYEYCCRYQEARPKSSTRARAVARAERVGEMAVESLAGKSVAKRVVLEVDK